MADPLKFQHFEVLRKEDGSLYELGRGAMGITYKAYDTNLRCHVALKVINNNYLNSEVARQRFLREARAAAALRHPNVATVFHLGQEDGSYFYAMEFVDGETVEAYMKRTGAIPVVMALGIVDQVARALGAALKQGLIHRDIKPANLMLVQEDENEFTVKVIDFGLAKAANKDSAEDSATLTLGGFLGTPHFASPEQLEERDLDVRSDIYSLGVTLWYMLAGQTPFSGSLAQVMSQHLNRPPPLEVLKDQPPEVLRLIEHLLQKDPGNRPQSPADLRKEVEACLDALRNRGDAGNVASEVVGNEVFETAVFEGAVASSFSQSSPPSLSASPAPSQSPPVVPPSVSGQPGAEKNPLGLYFAVVGVAVLVGIVGWVWHSKSNQTGVADAQPTQTPTAVPVASATAVPSATPESRYEKLITQASDKEYTGDDAGALALYGKALSEFPDEAEPKTRMEMIAAKLRTEGARPPLNQFLEMKPALEDAAEKGVVSAQMLLGERLRKSNSPEALRWYHAAIKNNNPEAMVKAGLMLSNGLGTEDGKPDMVGAAELFDRATQAGDGTGMFLLSECYLNPNGKKGVPYDPQKAVSLLMSGWGRLNLESMNQLGTLYRKGEGVPQDYDMAYKLFSDAGQLGNLDAQGNLGVLYALGQGVPKNSSKAVELFKDGALKDNAVCMYLYGLALESGDSVEKNASEAKGWMIKAAKLRNPLAQKWCADKGIDYVSASP